MRSFEVGLAFGVFIMEKNTLNKACNLEMKTWIKLALFSEGEYFLQKVNKFASFYNEKKNKFITLRHTIS